MALSPQHEAVLNQAKFSNGGINFISDISKINVQQQPILVVGLGGTGIDAMLRVKSKVNETFKTGVDPNTGKRKTAPDNIRFIGIDTDKESFYDPQTQTAVKSYRGMYVEEHEALNIGCPDVVGYIASAKKNNLTYITDWVSETLSFTDASGGAGGIRQVSRICLFRSFDKVYQKFYTTIKEIITQTSANTNQQLLVFVIGGLSGGTGSGTFIDIPYIIQQAAMSAFGMATADNIWGKMVMMGYFVTPDVSGLRNTADYIKYNGYAALKELDYLMGLPDRQETFDQQYSASVTVHSNAQPYGLVNLVSSQFMDGTPVKDAYSVAMQVIAENIIYFISFDDGGGDDKNNLTAWGYQSNVQQQIREVVNNLEATNQLKPVGYRYGIIGSAGKILPVQDIMTCLASKLLDSINEMWEAHGEPTSKEVSIIVGPAYFAFDENSLTSKLRAGSPVKFEDIFTNPASYPQSSKDAVAKNNGNAQPDFEKMLRTLTERIDANFAAKSFMDGIKENFTEKLKAFFTNTAPIVVPNPLVKDEKPTYGPRFANDIMVGVHGGNELNAEKFCDDVSQKLTNEYNQIAESLPNMEAAANTKRAEAQKSVFQSGKLYEEYMHMMENVYNLKLRLHLIQRLLVVYQNIREMILDENHKVFGTIYQTLNSLRKIFDENMKIMGDVTKKRSVEGAVMDWYVVSFTNVNEAIKEMLDDAKIGVSTQNLYRTIWENRVAWSSDNVKEFKVFEEITDFLATEFNEVLSEGMETYLRKEYESSSGYTSFDDFIKRKIDTELLGKSEIMFNERKNIIGILFNPPGRTYIQVPKECSTIISALESIHPNDIACSANKTRIVYNKSVYGIPVYCYGMIEDLERVYEINANAPGTHLYQSTKANWANLPALCPIDTYSDTYQNPREAERIKKANEVFEKAYEYGIIREAEGALKVHEAVFAGEVDVKSMLENAPTDPNGLVMLYKNLVSYLDPKNDLPENPKYPNGYDKVLLQRSATKESAKLWFTASYQLILRVEEEIKKYDAVKAAADEVKTRIDSFKVYYTFAKALLTDVVIKQGPKYYYAPSLEGVEPIELCRMSDLEHHEQPEYDVFNIIFVDRKLPDSQQKQLESDVNSGFVALEDGDYDAYCSKIDELTEHFISVKTNLEFNLDSIENGKVIFTFYDVIINFLKGLK